METLGRKLSRLLEARCTIAVTCCFTIRSHPENRGACQRALLATFLRAGSRYRLPLQVREVQLAPGAVPLSVKQLVRNVVSSGVKTLGAARS